MRLWGFSRIRSVLTAVNPAQGFAGVALFIGACSASAGPVMAGPAARHPYPAIIAEIGIGDSIFTAVVIEPHWDDTGEFSARYRMGEAMVAQAQTHIEKIYREAFPERAAAGFFDALFVKTPLMDDRSRLFVLYEGQGFTKIVGTLKESWANTDHPRLPSAPDVGWPALGPRKLKWVDHSPTEKFIRGGERELKTFTIRNPPGLDLMPTVLAAARRTGFFSSTDTFVEFQTSLEGVLAERKGGVSARAYSSGILHGFGDPNAPFRVWARPSHYRLSCDPALRGYYEKLGFSVVENFVSRDGSLWMEITSERIAGWFRNELKHRPGREALRGAYLEFQSILSAAATRETSSLEAYSDAYRTLASDPKIRCELLSQRAREWLDPDVLPSRGPSP